MKVTFSQSALSMLIFASILPFSTTLKGQSNPIPFDLSAEPYEFSAWDSLSPKGTFPESMVFHYVAANQTAPFYTDANSDYDCAYHKSKRPRINGLMNQGIGIVTTSSSQYNDCDAGAADNRFMGAVILALNATERNNIRMRWKSETVTPGDGNGVPTDPRVWNLRLQYRLGNSGLFNDFPGSVEFISSTATGDSVQFGPLTLPSVCNNQPVIQLRWIYFESSAGVGGSRPQLRLDDIEVTSDQTVGIIENQTTADGAFTIFPNPAHGQFSLKAELNNEGSIIVNDQLGRQVMLQTFNQPLTTFDCSALPKGIYFVKVTYMPDGQFSTKKLLIQ
jgi:hypothetical protein